MKLYEYYHKEKDNMSDLVIFNENGKIVSWFLYSNYLKDWFNVPLNYLKTERPGRIDAMQERIVNEVIPSLNFSEIDDLIDQDRDDKLTRGD